MNSLFNGKVIKNSKYKNLFISNASGDSGGSIGCVLLERKIKKKSKFQNLISRIPSRFIFDTESYNIFENRFLVHLRIADFVKI